MAIRTPVPFAPLEGVPGESLGRFPRLLYPFSFCGGASGGPLSLPPKKAAKETAKGDLFRGGPLWDPSPTTKGAPPPSIPNGGRGTGERGRENGDGGYGLPQPVTSVTGFAMTRFYCLVLSLYAGLRRGVAMSRYYCLAHSLYAEARWGVTMLRLHCLALCLQGVLCISLLCQTGLHNR